MKSKVKKAETLSRDKRVMVLKQKAIIEKGKKEMNLQHRHQRWQFYLLRGRKHREQIKKLLANLKFLQRSSTKTKYLRKYVKHTL